MCMNAQVFGIVFHLTPSPQFRFVLETTPMTYIKLRLILLSTEMAEFTSAQIVSEITDTLRQRGGLCPYVEEEDTEDYNKMTPSEIEQIIQDSVAEEYSDSVRGYMKTNYNDVSNIAAQVKDEYALAFMSPYKKQKRMSLDPKDDSDEQQKTPTDDDEDDEDDDPTDDDEDDEDDDPTDDDEDDEDDDLYDKDPTDDDEYDEDDDDDQDPTQDDKDEDHDDDVEECDRCQNCKRHEDNCECTCATCGEVTCQCP